MYTHCNTAISRAADSSPMQYSTAPQLQQQYQYQYQVSPGELETTVSQLNSEVSYSNNGCSSGSGCSSYMGSPSYETQRVTASLLQRSVSSHSLQKTNNNNNNIDGVHHHPFSALFAEYLLDSHDAPVRRVYSAGDLHTNNGMQHYHQSDSPLLSESNMIIEGMSRANPYSPEEKKARIERYRSKRNQRNFNKKIKYACRKTLADSRPRIRGRFARNDEIVMNPEVQWSHIGTGEELEDDIEDENWANFFNSLDPANLAQEPHCSSSFGVFY